MAGQLGQTVAKKEGQHSYGGRWCSGAAGSLLIEGEYFYRYMVWKNNALLTQRVSVCAQRPYNNMARHSTSEMNSLQLGRCTKK